MDEQTATVKESPLNNVISRQQDGIEGLRKIVNGLLERLMPVRRSQPKSESPTTAEKAQECTIIETLDSHNAQLASIRNSVEIALEELQI